MSFVLDIIFKGGGPIGLKYIGMNRVKDGDNKKSFEVRC